MRSGQLKRRELITLLGGAVALAPLAAHAQQAERVRRVGVFLSFAADDPIGKPRIAAFRQGMQERGWREGHNLQIDYRWFDAERINSHAAELVGAMPEVLVATNTPSVAALRHATGTIPIVFVGIGDPVGQGFVESLARPGGNITGFTGLEFSLGEKWVGLLKELAPGVTRIAYLFHPEIGPYYPLWLKSIEAAAAPLGVETAAAPVRAIADIERTISAIAVQPNGGLVVQPDSYTIANRRLIIELAARHRLPAVYTYPYEAAEGGLVSYGPDVSDQYRRCAAYVDRILRGERPADLPVQQPLKYQLVVNLKTAKALGIEVPTSMQLLADEVIE
jgi:putative ABC transport system substrate-binding protein